MSGDIVAKIVVIKRNGTDGPQFPLRSNTCLFGRKADCDIRIQLPNVSQEHALVKVECDKKINITNLSSCNQTLVNGRPVSQVDIQHLDVLTISDRSFRFELPLSVQKQVRPLETQQHQSSTLTTTPQGKKTPKMPTPKGSPRTPPTGGTLKENIWALHRHSMPLPEEEEGLASPADVKVPFSSLDINVDPKEGSFDVQPGNEMKSEVAQKPKRRSKRVSFGPVLSPEQFDKDLPPATPVRRGATPKRHSTGGGKFINTSSSSAKKRRSVAVLPCADPIVEEEFDTLKSITPQTPELSQPNHEFQDNEERPETSSISRTFDDQDLRESIHEINTPTGSRRSSLRSARRSPSCPEHQMNIKDVLKDIRPHSLEFCQPNQEFQEIEQLPRNSELGELNESTLEVSTPSGNRRTSLRLAGTSPGFPVDHTVPECQSWLVSSDDIEEEEDETILDSDDYTSEEDENDGGGWCSDKNKDLANSEVQDVKNRMVTPLRKEIARGFQLRKTKKKMNTPLKKEIVNGIQLRQTKKKMNTPLRIAIADGLQLRKTKKKMNTPLRKEIADGIQLRKTKKKMNTPLRKEIADGIQLRETKKKMNTPLRKEIADGIQLRETKKKMNTPLRKEIADGIQLRETKKTMNTPLRKEIADGIQLRETKKKMNTPLRREIVNGIKLRQTRKKMNTPLRMEIAGEIQLRKTKKKMNTPLRKQIADGIQLRQTKKKLPSPLQKDLQARPRLRETKKKLATPVKKEIESKPQLRQTVKSMNAHLQDEIKAGVKLRETKQTMPLDLQIEIIKGKKLKPTKKSLPSPVKKAINNGLPLNKTKKTLPTPIKRQIEDGAALKQTSNRSSKRKRSEDEAPMITQPKKMKLSLSDEKDSGTQRAVKTPVRKEIPTQPKLRATRYRLATPVRKQIHSMPTLRAVRHKSFSVSATRKALRKPTYAEIVKRAKKTSVMNEVAKTKPKAASITGVAAMTKLGTLQSQENQVESEMSTRSPRRKRSQWMSSLALAVGGVKTRETQLEDFQGLSELFQSPPADQLPTKRSSKKQKAGNWLSSLAKATNGRRKRGTPITDLDGIPEMFFTPPCDIRRVESIEDPPNSVSPSDEELPMEEALIPTKTPSLRRPGKDTIAATLVNTTPQESLELVQPVALSRTPSLRHSVKDVVSINMVPPIQVSRTPSLRSDMIPASVLSSQVVETEQSNFQTSIEPSKTPSLRSSDDVQTVLRKSIGNSRKRIENARKSTKHNNAVENCEDFFVPNMFASPKPQPKRYSRKSEGLQGVARLLRTPEDKEKAIMSPKLDGIKEMMNVRDLKSPNFVGLRVLMKTPKSSSSVDDEEQYFNSELFDAKTVEEDRSQLSDDSTDVTVTFEQVIDLTSPENKMSEANQLVDVDVRPLVGITRAKRSAPQDLTEPLPKRSRRTRLANTRNVFSHPKAVVKKQTSRQKGKSVAVAQTTPEPFVFKRTQLDPIIEVPSPVRSISISSPEDDQASHSQIRTRSGNKMETEAIPPLKSSLPGNYVSSQTESSFDSSTEEITKTRSGTRKKIKIARAPVKARSTRNSRGQDASSLDIVSFKKTTATHIYVAKRDVDETSLNIPIRRSRRTCNIVEEDSSVLENSETKRNTRLSNNLQKSEHIMNLRKTRSRAVEVMNVDLSDKTHKESSRLDDAKTTLRTREKIDGDTSLSRMTKSLRDEENLSEKDWDAEQRNNALEETKSTRSKRNKSGTDELDTTSAKGEDGGLVAVKTRSSMRKRDTEQSVISKTRSSQAKNVTSEEERKTQLEDCMLEEAKSTRNTRSKSANAKRNVSSTRRKTRSSNAEDTVPAEDKGIEKEVSTVREPSKRQLKETVSCQPQEKGPKRTTKQAKHKQEGQVTAPKTGGTNKRRQDDSSVTNAPEPKRTTRSSTRIQEKLSSRK